MLETKFGLSELVLAALERYLTAARAAAAAEPASPTTAPGSAAHSATVAHFAAFLQVLLPGSMLSFGSHAVCNPCRHCRCIQPSLGCQGEAPLAVLESNTHTVCAQAAAAWRAKPMPWDRVQRLWTQLVEAPVLPSDRCLMSTTATERFNARNCHARASLSLSGVGPDPQAFVQQVLISSRALRRMFIIAYRHSKQSTGQCMLKCCIFRQAG